MAKTVQLKVVVLEDDKVVDARIINYYPGQEYAVVVHTPDGIDRECYYRAGKGPDTQNATFRVPR